MSACWQWGINQEIVEFDPWKSLIKRIKVPPKPMPKPFTKKEIKAIIQGFEQDKYYSHYVEFVEFLFGTGCRTGEAIGLCWKHLSEDCSTVWIGESLSRGIRKATKTNRARTITLTSRLQSLLLSMKSENFDLEKPVFTTRQGNPIDDHNFRNRAWKSVLAKVGVEYRKPYNTRHTLISHALDRGMNPVAVAQLTGHDVQTLYENYAGNVNSRPRLPEILE
ncbi:MAG: site-specific integrase [Xenococcaceae cyanobacterium MO_234.B1]|nr:site-specific integrase [Xenococcaceae cyanobacterium MO_234.B1]